MKQIPDYILDDTEHVEFKNWECHGFPVESVVIKTAEASQHINKKPGEYITISTGMLNQLDSTQEAGECLVELLTPILAPYHHKRICVFGLGNQDLPHDSLGPATIKNIPAKFLELSDAERAGRFEKLTTFIPGVSWYTNMQPSDVIAGVVSASKPACLLLIDSEITPHFENLCRAIHINTGEGMTQYYAKNTINWDTMGVPVVSIGVPTVIALEHLMADTQIPEESRKEEFYSTIDVQDVIAASSAIIAYAITRISYPLMTQQQCAESLWLRQSVNSSGRSF